MHGSIDLLSCLPPRQDKSSFSGPGVGNCSKRSCPGDRGWGKFKNNLSLILRSTCHFLRGLHDGCGPQDNVFLRANAGNCRRVVGEE